jgi:hypothetical protein
MAITEMGDCDEIGKQLNKRHKPQTEWTLMLIAIIAGIGCIIMHGSSHFEKATGAYAQAAFSTSLKRCISKGI